MERMMGKLIGRRHIRYNNHVIIKPFLMYFKILLFCTLKCLKEWFNYIRLKTLWILKMATICYKHDKIFGKEGIETTLEIKGNNVNRQYT